MGRNGFGKTSFINSVKMLFSNTSEEIRRTVQRKRTPTPKQFVMGINNEWWGVLNKSAKDSGKNSCSISAVWVDDENCEVSACREWVLDFQRDDYESHITVNHLFRGEMHDDEAEQYLDSLLPKSYIPFFFFDGEEIQTIAESNDSENIKTMELLLNIRPLENMQETLDKLGRTWKRDAANEENNLKFNNKERQLAGKQDQKKVYYQQLSDFQHEIEEEESLLKQVDRQLRLLRGNSSQQKEMELKKDIENQNGIRGDALERLVSCWKRDAFLCTNAALYNRLMKRLEPLLESGVGEQQELLMAVRQRLHAMFETLPFPSPRLQDNQVEFYKKRIDREIEALGVTESSTDLDISHERGKKLFKQMTLYSKGNSLLRSMQSDLDTAQDAKKRIHDFESKLKITGGLSEKKQQEYDNLLLEETVVKERLMSLERKKISVEKESETLERDITKITQELGKLYRDVQASNEKRKQFDFAKRLKEALGEVKKRLRQQKRKELEDAYNRHLSALLTSNNLINRVEINEHFELTYKDDQGNAVGMSTVSAGMKQLSATVLLWALKETSGRDIPVIIDTPMGRIDRSHQNNLLENYYPTVAKQVILLPTDSELDREKYHQLKPFICQEYRLSNPTGKAAKIEKVTGGLYG
jgi:DNA sulfur modification protein DndD